MRLPYFLKHYRRLGVGHFLIVSNDSSDGTNDLLKNQPDVSLWQTQASYKAARFGMDWLNWLQRRYAPGKWALTVDADELLIYPDWERRNLPELTGWMTAQGQVSFGAMLLDLYPKGSPDAFTYAAGESPLSVLQWFDGNGYQTDRRGRHQARCVTGGVRARAFFADAPEAAPVLSKVPLVRWQRSFAYLSSTHVILPPRLNETHDADKPSGVLLHTKFLPGIGNRAREDHARGQQYTKLPAHDAYYEALTLAPDLWTKNAQRYRGWEQLAELGLMQRGRW